MRKACSFLMIALVVLVSAPLMTAAQEFVPVPGRMRANQLLYTGPGPNAGVLEFAASGRDVVAQGRNTSTDWIEIVLDGQVEGWVPAATVRPLDGSLSNLPVKGGLLDLGNGPYSATDDNIRQAEAEMLKVQRPLRAMQARFNRLQGYLATNCSEIPLPDAPAITDGMIAAIPELEQVRTELTFVRDQTELALLVLQEACAESGSIGEGTYNRLLQHVYNAQNAYVNIRRFMNEITGLEYVEPGL